MKDRLLSAYATLIDKDGALLELDANERSITHKLAEHLQVEFPEWDVDCEYNRDGEKPKRLSPQSVSSDDTDAHTVFPDIVVHQRNSETNLVVIEAKKRSSAKKFSDEEKLKSLKKEYEYQFAYLVVFPVGHVETNPDLSEYIFEVEA